MSALWDMSFPPTDKLVLLALADCANDEGLAWPSIATLARKTGCSERTVQRSLRAAEVAGLVRRKEVIGKGCKYIITPRHSVTPDKVSPVTNASITPDTVSPHPRHSVTQTVNEPLENRQAICEVPSQASSPDDEKLKPEHIVEHWNTTAARLGKQPVRVLNPSRRNLLRARIRQYPIDDFMQVFANIEGSSWLRSKPSLGFDWMIKEANFIKILEGNYQ